VQVRCDEEVAIHIGPKPCVCAREGAGEASAGERIGQPLSRESHIIQGADVLIPDGRRHGGTRQRECSDSSARLETSHGDVSVKGKIHSRMSKTPMAVSASKV
jgi:hypothetical protein